MTDDLVQVFDSRGDAYKHAFQIFLANTDQKRNARQCLERFVATLPSRRVCIDAGAGSGELTAWLSQWFEQTIAVEPNGFLLDMLRQLVPDAELIPKPILDAAPSVPADLVLCSHTFYYLERILWLEHLERLLSWMTPTGATIVVLQDHDTDCMTMLERFFGYRFDLADLAQALKAKHGNRYKVELTRDEAHVRTRDLASAYVIAEFILNLLPIQHVPRRLDLERYVRDHFATADGGYQFSCHQVFLHITHPHD